MIDALPNPLYCIDLVLSDSWAIYLNLHPGFASEYLVF